MPKKRPSEEAPSLPVKELEASLSRWYGKVTLRVVKDDAKPALESRRKGAGTYDVTINAQKLPEFSQESLESQIVGSIESLEMRSSLEGKPELEEVKRTLEQELQVPAIQLLYRFLFQQIGIRRKSLEFPVLQYLARSQIQHLKEGLKTIHPLPKHLQFLLALSDDLEDEPADEAVKRAISQMKRSKVLEYLYNPTFPLPEKIRKIQDLIVPSYRFFLRKDTEQWKPEHPQNEEIEQETREEIKETLQEPGEEQKHGEHAEKQEEQGEEQQGKESEQKDKNPDGESPDYNPTYETPEGEMKELAPEEKGFKIEISPPLTGYYSYDHKSVFDANIKKWTGMGKLSDYKITPTLIGKRYRFFSSFKGMGLKSLPLPVGYAFDTASIKYTGQKPRIFRDHQGSFFLQLSGPGACDLEIEFAKEQQPVVSSPTAEDSKPLYQGTLSPGTEALLQNVATQNDVLQKARMILEGIRKTHRYPPGKNDTERLNSAKNVQAELQKNCPDSSTYIKRLDSSHHLECFSAATLMIAQLRKLGVPARLVLGHHVQGVNDDGNAEINSGNGHGWVEVWDGSRWVRMDPTPPLDPKDAKNKADPKDKKEKEKKKKQNQKSETADDGGEDQESGEQEEQDSDGQDEEDGSSEADQENEALKEDLDPEEAFKKMYEELQQYMAEQPEKEAIDEAAQEIKTETAPPTPKDPTEEMLEQKYPGLTPEQIKELARFVERYKELLSRLKQIPNPDPETVKECPTLADHLRSIYDGVISRSLKERRVLKFPVAEGADLRLHNPVQLFMDRRAGLKQSHSFMEQRRIQKEHLEIIKVRRRKILDGSGSMHDHQKLEIQTQIEILDNAITAEKQIELNELSQRLRRDVQLETETWQFGIRSTDEHGQIRDFSRLKPLSSTFEELEQSSIAELAGRAAGGTNDFDPLESIYSLLIDESGKTKPGEVSVLDRIKAGFYIREITAHESLRRKKPTELSANETVYFRNLGARVKDYQRFLDELKRKAGKPIEPILEVIEISSDGGSDDPKRLKAIVQSLRDLGVIVICYGLGKDGGAAIDNYGNPYNPSEGGVLCVNVADYPKKKAGAWRNILDKV